MHSLHLVQWSMNICFTRKLHYRFQWIEYARSWHFCVTRNWYISNVFKNSRSRNVTMLTSSLISTRMKKWILMNSLKKNSTSEIFLRMKFIDENAVVKFMKNIFNRFFHVARAIDNAQKITIYADCNDFHDRLLRTLEVIFFNSDLEKIAFQMTELFIFVYVVTASVIRETMTAWYENWNQEQVLHQCDRENWLTSQMHVRNENKSRRDFSQCASRFQSASRRRMNAQRH